MKKFLNIALVAGAALSLAACTCVNTKHVGSYGTHETAGETPTVYNKDCSGKPAKGGSGDAMFKSKQSK